MSKYDLMAVRLRWKSRFDLSLFETKVTSENALFEVVPNYRQVMKHFNDQKQVSAGISAKWPLEILTAIPPIYPPQWNISRQEP